MKARPTSMMTARLRSSMPLLLLVPLAGCGGVAEGEGAPLSSEETEGIQQASEVANLEISQGHRLVFYGLPTGDGNVSIAMVEMGTRDDASIAQSIPELAGKEVSARDMFEALAPSGTDIPKELRSLPKTMAREIGWARDLVTETSQLAVAGAACDNANFTASTPDGILDYNATWLDRHPTTTYSQFLYHSACTGNDVVQTRTRFELARNNVRAFRGKVCGEPLDTVNQPVHDYYNSCDGQWYDLPMRAKFTYQRQDGTWGSAGPWEIPTWSTYWYYISWNGYQNQEWDFRVIVDRAQPQDWIDYMRSYID